MLKIADSQLIHLKYDDIKTQNPAEDKKEYVWSNTSFFVDDTRLKSIELRFTFLNGYTLPPAFQIYYFQQISSCQVRPVSLTGFNGTNLVVRTDESDFWKSNPLIVDKIGFYALIKADFKFKIDSFKIV